MRTIRIARSASVVGAATLVSRILGLAREMVILNLFGTHLTDAFYAAFRLPNTLRYLMGEGALSAAFIPVFSDCLHKRGRREAWELATAVLLWLLVVAGGVAAAGMLCAPWIVRTLLAGFAADPEKLALTAGLTRWMFPYIVFVSLVALCMGILNSLGHFAMPSLAQAAFNLTVILAAFFISPLWGAEGGDRVFALAVGVLAGGAVQLAMQTPVLRRRGFRLSFGRVWRNPEIGRIARLVVPALAGLAVYHVNLIVDNLFASFLPEGSITYLFAANRLIQFPIGTFAIGISTVAFPLMASRAVAGDIEGLKEALTYALRLCFFITIPAAAGLIVLGRPIIRLLYERGEFLADGSTDPTYWAVLFYAVGVFCIGGVSVVVRCFYSLQDTRTPVRVACVAVAVNIILDIVLMGPLRHGGLALATSLAAAVNLSILLLLLRRRLGLLGLRRVARSLAKIVLATAVMAAVAWIVFLYAGRAWPGGETAAKALRVFVPLLAGVGGFLAAARAARAPELAELAREFRSRGRNNMNHSPRIPADH
ncbi:MAG: murein biosynthesis integral membrane protein MurJ [bacterium]|nr:murein biosynthesis integral membrane protein MurJ [bacterium]